MDKYYKPKGDYIDIPCYIEKRWDGEKGVREHITFARVLSSDWANYTPAIMSVPAELEPYVSHAEYPTTDGGYFTCKALYDYEIRLKYYKHKAYIECNFEFDKDGQLVVYNKPLLTYVFSVREGTADD